MPSLTVNQAIQIITDKSEYEGVPPERYHDIAWQKYARAAVLLRENLWFNTNGGSTPLAPPGIIKTLSLDNVLVDNNAWQSWSNVVKTEVNNQAAPRDKLIAFFTEFTYAVLAITSFVSYQLSVDTRAQYQPPLDKTIIRANVSQIFPTMPITDVNGRDWSGKEIAVSTFYGSTSMGHIQNATMFNMPSNIILIGNGFLRYRDGFDLFIENTIKSIFDSILFNYTLQITYTLPTPPGGTVTHAEPIKLI